MEKSRSYNEDIEDDDLEPLNTFDEPEEKISELDLESDHEPEPIPIKSVLEQNKSNKIALNIGGKKFNLKKKFIDLLQIPYSKFPKIINNNQITYFLDRDPYYFSKITSLIKLYGLDQEKILSRIDDYSDQLLGELCFYGIIDEKFNPRPKLRLKRAVTFSSRNFDIIKVTVGDQTFETSSCVLSRSNYFDNKLKIIKSNQLNLTKVDPKIFRYILNFLRTGELYVYNESIIQLLENYDIEYEKVESKKINNNIVTHYTMHTTDVVNHQITDCINMLDPKSNKIPSTDNWYQFIDNKCYYPEATFASPNVENMNIINTESTISFGSDIVFNLTDKTKDLGECIEDLLLCIDIPILNPAEGVAYRDLVEYHLIEDIRIVINQIGEPKNTVLTNTNGSLLYLYPMIYTDQPDVYSDMITNGNHLKVLFNDNLIDIHRVILPLFLLKGGRSHLPIKKMINSKMSAQLIVKMSPTKKLFKDKIKEIPLLNICLISNYITLAPNILVQKMATENGKQIRNVGPMPINIELKKIPIMHLYDRTHSITVPIQSTSNAIYDTAILPLDKFGFIKDLFFIIVTKEDLIADNIERFSAELIEFEILSSKDQQLSVYAKMDSFLLNSYIPLKKLGHRLPTGIYYYTFSSDPKKSQFLGGYLGEGSFIRLKVQKMNGVVKFYINEYVKKII